MSPRLPDDAVPQPIGTDSDWVPVIRAVGTLAEGTRPVPQRRARRWPAFAAAVLAVLAAGAIVAGIAYRRAARREQLDGRYPVVAEGAVAQAIEDARARWAAGAPRLVRTLAEFRAPALDSLVGVGECAFGGAGARFTVGPDLATDVQAYVHETLEAAARGRFASDTAMTTLLDQLTGPVIVTASGVSYAFDPATGSLACAGRGSLRAVE